MLLEMSTEDNIGRKLDENTLNEMGAAVFEKYEIDVSSRSEWAAGAREALDLIGSKRESKSFPFEKAANVRYPLLHSATVQFASRAYPEIVKGSDVVKVKTEGADRDGTKAERAARVGKFMSYQLLHQMPEWDEDTDSLLHALPVVGCAFRKVYWDGTRNKPKSEMVSALDLVVNMNCPSLEQAPQVTHEKYFYPQEIDERIRKGIFLDQNLGDAQDSGDEDLAVVDSCDPMAPHKFLECHCYYDLDGDGLSEPWIVTLHADTQRVVRVAPGFGPESIEFDEENQAVLSIRRDNYFVKYIFWPHPKGGFYGVGLGHALQDISASINTALNQMLDAGTLQNSGGGFIGSGLNTKQSTFRFSPGKYHTVQASGGTIRDAIVTMQHPGPSTVLFQLLGMLVDVAKELAGNQDVLTGNVSSNIQPTTLMALIEQGLQQFTAVYKRIYRSLGKEFQRLRKLNSEYLSEEEYSAFQDQDGPSAREDFGEGDLDIYPVADPNVVTDMQRAGQTQLLMELTGHPVIGAQLDPKDITKRILKHAQIEGMDTAIIEEPPQDPGLEVQLKKAMAEIQEIESKIQIEQAKVQLEQAKAEANFDLENRKLQLEAQTNTDENVGQGPDLQGAKAAQDLEYGRLEKDADLEAREQKMLLAEMEITARVDAIKAERAKEAAELERLEIEVRIKAADLALRNQKLQQGQSVQGYQQ